MKHTLIVGAASVFCIAAMSSAWAGQVSIDVSGIVNGNPADADDVRNAFTGLATEVNDNDTRISANTSALADKADQTAVDAAVGANTTAITNVAADVDDHETRIGALEAGGVDPTCPSETVDVPGVGCVFKYEAAVSATEGGAVISAASADDIPCAPTAADCKDGIFAVSQQGVQPAVYINWYQAAMACANVGGRLPSNAEWQVAALGSPLASEGSCATSGNGGLRTTGLDTNCASTWGVVDMVGNVWEFTADWTSSGTINNVNDVDPLEGASVVAAEGATGLGNGNFASTLPAVVTRGGDGAGGTPGTFAYASRFGPEFAAASFGFRCVVPKQ
jgi:hypothetical protein